MTGWPAAVTRMVVTVLAVGLVAGCSQASTTGSRSGSTTRAPAAERETVTITMRTIVSATKLAGTVEPVPGTTITAPASGTLRLADLDRLAGADLEAGQRLGTVELPCDPPANEVTATGAGGSGQAEAPATTEPCRRRRLSIDGPAAGRLLLAGPIERAVQRGDATVEVADGEEIGTIAPEGWRIRLPLGDDDQPARFAHAPPLAYALLPDTAEPVFQVRFDRLDYADDGSVAVLAVPLDPPQLVRGAKVTVSFVTNRRQDVPALPVSAVRSKGNTGEVLVISDGESQTETKQVIVGPDDGSWIEVQGLGADDRVVRYPLEGELGGP